ncbi:hypothetical protein BB561_002848 [Smittium simulii]|uniref:Plus3 domain-containing protein n=1 Tax=Smittium simulii TaxID=133385 RepID=A0A2T9YNY0_9FUNG|nr:hypothetical protein BB561_002848 [Smittium simulii]
MDDLEGEILALFGKNDNDKDSSTRREGATEYKKRRRSNLDFSDNDVDVDSPQASKIKGRSAYKTDLTSFPKNDSEFLDVWGPDLIGDDEDRASLNALPEIEREKILAERQEQRDILWEKRELKRKLQEGIQAGTVKIDRNFKSSQYRDDDSDSRTNNYSRTRTRTSKSSAQLTEIKRLRDEKRSKTKHMLPTDQDGEDSFDEYSNDLSPEYSSKISRKSAQSKKASDDPVISLSDLNSIFLSRDLLDKWIYTPMFNETIVGCYIRIKNINKDMDKYCVAEITKVLEKSEPSYMLKRHYVDTRLRVKVVDQTLDIGIDTLSNSEFNEAEYDDFINTLSNNHNCVMRTPTLKFLSKKKKDIEIKNNYSLTAKDIDYRVKMFQDIGKKLGNIGHRRAETHLRLQVAQQENNIQEVERLNKELAKLPKPPTSGPYQQGMPTSNQFAQIGVSDSSRQQNSLQGSAANNTNPSTIGFGAKLSARHTRVSEHGFGLSLAGSALTNSQINLKIGSSPYLSASNSSANLSNQTMNSVEKAKTRILTKPRVTKGFETLMSVPDFDLSFFK